MSYRFLMRRVLFAASILTGSVLAADPAPTAADQSVAVGVTKPAPARPQEKVAAPGAPKVSSGAGASVWQPVFSDAGRRMEIDLSSVKKEPDGKVQALGRMIFEKPVHDAMSGQTFSILEALNRYDCSLRTFATVQRVYRKDEATRLREEQSKSKIELPVRTGTLDDKMLRFACKPSISELKTAFNDTVEQAKAAIPPRKELMRTDLSNTAPAPAASPVVRGKATPAPAVRSRAKKKAPAKAPVERRDIQWSHQEGEGGPEHWGKLKEEYALCGSGSRQSPIDLRDSIRVDLPPIGFAYRPAQFRIVDNGHTVQVAISENRLTLMGKEYELVQFHFHRPAEERIGGKSFDMVAHLVHRAHDKELAVVAVLLERSDVENPVVQTLWNYLPLEKNIDVYPPNVPIDLNQLLPEQRDYITYMGSLTTPPCTEGVRWLVLKTPVKVSDEQVSIFSRLYPNNARPLQDQRGRLIKESR